MSLRASLLIDARAEGAQAAVKALKAETDGLGKSVADAGGKARTADAQTDRLAAAQRGAASAATAQAAAERQAAASVQLAQSHRIAAGSVGNLTSQFNDIGVMMAAGQNPLTLAIQQGTQISQVIGPMGAAGAVRSLGAAFMGMLSPVSLLTIGAVGLGATLVNWLSSSDDAAEDAEDAFEAMDDAAQRYIEATQRARQPLVELREEFGRMAEEARANFEDIAEAERRAFSRATDATIGAVTGGRNPNDPSRLTNERVRELSGTFGLKPRSNSASDRDLQLVNELVQASQALEAVRGGAIADQIAAFRAAVETFDAVARARDGVSAEEDAIIGKLRERLNLLIEVQAAEDDTAGRARETAEQERLLGQQMVAVERERQEAEYQRQQRAQVAAYQQANASMAQSAADLAAAREMEAALRAQAEVQEAISTYGAGSVEAAEARVTVERRAFEELQRSKGAAGDLLVQLLATWDAANNVASVDMANNVTLAANEAARFAQNLAAAMAMPITNAMRDEDAAMAQDVRPGAEGEARQAAAVANFKRLTTPTRTSRGGRGGAGGGGGRGAGISEAERERQAVQELVVSLKDELAILREADPVRQELLRHREVLTAATDAERAEIERLIATREREGEVARQTAESADFWRQNAGDLIQGMSGGVDGLSDAFDRLKGKIADAAFEAALFGTGPLANLFGGGVKGGLLGVLFPGKAEGGMIHGPGGGRSDDVPIMASAGEYVVNARATARNRTLLEAINAGMPAFADGGMVGGGASGGRGAASGARGPVNMVIDVRGARGNAEIEEMVQRGIRAGLEQYDRSVLPLSYRRIRDDDRVIG